MKKFVSLLLFLLVSAIPITANETILQAEITFNWDNITQAEREENISQIKQMIFNENKNKKQKEFKDIYKDWLKDSEYRKHYMVASAGYKEYKQYNISAMYLKRMSSLLIYALQPKDNLKTIYYYDAMGNLRYVDNIKGAYPNFPYYTEQYKRSGKLAGISYFSSKETQYIFKPNGEFRGVWHKENFYNKNGKVIMQRSNY